MERLCSQGDITANTLWVFYLNSTKTDSDSSDDGADGSAEAKKTKSKSRRELFKKSRKEEHEDGNSKLDCTLILYW